MPYRGRRIQLVLVCLMVFNATFNNNISVISWLSVLLVEDTIENHRPVASHARGSLWVHLFPPPIKVTTTSICFRCRYLYIYPVLVLFKWSNCIISINYCYIYMVTDQDIVFLVPDSC